MTELAPTLQAFFTDRLNNQLGASAHTVAAYRDTWRLLLTFSTARIHIPASRLDIAPPRRIGDRGVLPAWRRALACTLSCMKGPSPNSSATAFACYRRI
jgi:hypothetical protein